jgi:hypothetical protein
MEMIKVNKAHNKIKKLDLTTAFAFATLKYIQSVSSQLIPDSLTLPLRIIVRYLQQAVEEYFQRRFIQELN